jgi:hypothetical protein
VDASARCTGGRREFETYGERGPNYDEEVGAFAAGTDAAGTRKLAVCAGSCGTGNLHLVNGLFDCHRNQQPVLAIAVLRADLIGRGEELIEVAKTNLRRPQTIGFAWPYSCANLESQTSTK